MRLPKVSIESIFNSLALPHLSQGKYFLKITVKYR